MKKIILIFVGLFLFDIIYVEIYNQFLINIKPEFIQYPLLIINYLASSPAIFYDELLPFYALIPTYQSILIFLGNVGIQTFLIYWIFFKNKSNKKHVD